MILKSKLTVLFHLFLLTGLSISAILPSYFHEKVVAEGFDPVFLVSHPFEDDTIFVVEKRGSVWMIRDGVIGSEPYLNIESKVDNLNERGLQSIGFDSRSTETNIMFFAYYCVNGLNSNRLSRFTAVNDVVDLDSEEILLQFEPLSSTIHNGGRILVAGQYLYLFTGDGANIEHARNLNSMLGKVLRFNVDMTIPEDNPFYENLEGNYRAIYAMGFRNPFSGSIRPSTGTIYINDVGLMKWEEINKLEKGCDYGWPIIEGPIASSTAATPPSGDKYRDPVHTYYHEFIDGAFYCAIVGSTFYEPENPTFPKEYRGKYFYGDFCAGTITMFDLKTKERSIFASKIKNPVSLLVTKNGVFYYIGRGEGKLFKIEYTNSRAPTISFTTGDGQKIIDGEDALFIVGGSGDMPITFQWQKVDKNGKATDIPGANLKELTIKNVRLADKDTKYRVIVTNPFGKITSKAFAVLIYENLHLVIDIKKPVNNSIYEDCFQNVDFEGEAYDDLGVIPVEDYIWTIDFHHNTHEHPGATIPDVASGTFKLNFGETEPDISFSFKLGITDSRGIVKSKSVSVYPRLVTITVESTPPGHYVEIDYVKTVTPFTFKSPAGVTRKLRADDRTYDGTFYKFDSWSNNIDADDSFYALKLNTDLQDQTIKVTFLADHKIENGLTYDYYEGQWDECPIDIGLDDVVKSSGEFESLDSRVSELAPAESTDFLVQFTSYLMISKGDKYTFRYGFKEKNEDCSLKLVVDRQHIEYEGTPHYMVRKGYLIHINCLCKDGYQTSTNFKNKADATRIQLQLVNSEGQATVIDSKSLYKENPAPCVAQQWAQLFNISSSVVYGEVSNITFVVYNFQFEGMTFEVVSGPGIGSYLKKNQYIVLVQNEEGIIHVRITHDGNSVFCPVEPLEYFIEVKGPSKIALILSITLPLLVLLVGGGIWWKKRKQARFIKFKGDTQEEAKAQTAKNMAKI